jgi:hypothetical protein
LRPSFPDETYGRSDKLQGSENSETKELQLRETSRKRGRAPLRSVRLLVPLIELSDPIRLAFRILEKIERRLWTSKLEHARRPAPQEIRPL